MVKTLSLKIVGIPEAQARPRAVRRGKFVAVISPKSDWFHIVYNQAIKVRPEIPWDTPIYLQIRLVFPKPKSAKSQQIWKSTKPDADNLAKAVMDALTNARWWQDDGRIASLVVQKIYESETEQAGAVITAWQMDPATYPEIPV